MKTYEREQARALRSNEGRSVKEIARVVGVSTSSVSRWVRDIVLSPEQHGVLADANRLHHRQVAARAVVSANARARRLRWQQEGRLRARGADPLYVAGCMLYWAEGARDRNCLLFANSDAEMIRHFNRFVREEFDVADSQLAIKCNLFADHVERQREIEDFWLCVVGLPRSRLQKSTVNLYSKYSQKKRKNKLPFGTCRFAVYSTEVAQTVNGSIQEIAGFDRPEWVDM